MSWSLNRWIWRLEAPLYVGAPPAGALNRCRLYVPARTIRGAFTAEAARGSGAGFPEYSSLGGQIREQLRFTYLYPAEQHASGWNAWLPRFELTTGLCWKLEQGEGAAVVDEQFRRRLLWALPGTAIDPDSDSALEGSLRETECIQTTWRSSPASGGAVALIGYVFIPTGSKYKTESWQDLIDSVCTVFLGGDTRYGLGLLQRTSWETAYRVFGEAVDLDADEPLVRSSRVLAHARTRQTAMAGAIEVVGGWDVGVQATIHGSSTPLWSPGSRLREPLDIVWKVDSEGIWNESNEP